VTTWVSFQLHFDLGPFLHHQASLVASNFSQLAPPKPRRLLSAARAPPSLAVALRFSISSCRHHSSARGDPRFLISCGAALSLVALIAWVFPYHPFICWILFENFRTRNWEVHVTNIVTKRVVIVVSKIGLVMQKSFES
jgi:hypothetical protein